MKVALTAEEMDAILQQTAGTHVGMEGGGLREGRVNDSSTAKQQHSSQGDGSLEVVYVKGNDSEEVRILLSIISVYHFGKYE